MSDSPATSASASTASSSQGQLHVRFAPSPTGYLHVGGARTALFNWLLARQQGGKFSLRIEDTDAERSTEEAVEQILDALRWLGLDWDGEPVRQTDNTPRHREVLEQLEASGRVYRSYLTPEETDAARAAAEAAKKPFVFKRATHEPPADEIERRAAAGAPYVLRLDIGDEGAITWNDQIRGPLSFNRRDIGDVVLARTDGSMLYNFVCAVDDADMGMTLVLRGEDHISNTPKQIAVFEAMGVPVPEYGHVPLILGSDKKRLSKRHGATSVQQFRDEGYLPEAVVNFLALLGWSPGDDREVMSRDEIVAAFSTARINKAAAVFDMEKLGWLNGTYIRDLPRERVVALATDELRRSGLLDTEVGRAKANDGAWLAAIIELEVERSRRLTDFSENLRYFFERPTEFEEKGTKKFVAKEGVGTLMDDITAALRDGEFTPEAMESALRAIGEKHEVSFTRVAQPVRLAMTGRTASPPLFDMLVLLGRDEVLTRLATLRPQAG